MKESVGIQERTVYYYTDQELTVIQDIESQIATIIEYSNDDEKITYQRIKDFLENKKNLLTTY